MKWAKFIANTLGTIIAAVFSIYFFTIPIHIVGGVTLGMIGAYFHVHIISPILDRTLK